MYVRAEQSDVAPVEVGGQLLSLKATCVPDASMRRMKVSPA